MGKAHTKLPKAPPDLTPEYCGVLRGTGPEYINQHVGLLVYTWLSPEYSFWFFPTETDGEIIAGYVWNGQHEQWQTRRLYVSEIDCIF